MIAAPPGGSERALWDLISVVADAEKTKQRLSELTETKKTAEAAVAEHQKTIRDLTALQKDIEQAQAESRAAADDAVKVLAEAQSLKQSLDGREAVIAEGEKRLEAGRKSLAEAQRSLEVNREAFAVQSKDIAERSRAVAAGETELNQKLAKFKELAG